jgi:lipopolysaccharide export system ATP-binding protein
MPGITLTDHRTRAVRSDGIATTTQRLEAQGLRRRFGDRWVVDGVDLAVDPGEIVGLLGPNGAGKTVTFYMISGILRPTSGVINLGGVDITDWPMDKRARLGLGYLPQERSVFRHLTAEENLAVVYECRGERRRDASAQARKLLVRFGLSHLADVQASRLSGGEQRRLEVARAVASRPRIVLFDEPFAGIDPLTIEMLHELILDLRNEGIGVLLTDHNVMEAFTLCDRAYVLFDGRVIAEGSSWELTANPLVRRHFLGESFAPPGTGELTRPAAILNAG